MPHPGVNVPRVEIPRSSLRPSAADAKAQQDGTPQTPSKLSPGLSVRTENLHFARPVKSEERTRGSEHGTPGQQAGNGPGEVGDAESQATQTSAGTGFGSRTPPHQMSANTTCSTPKPLNRLLSPASAAGGGKHRHTLESTSPIPSPLTPTIEALLWRLDLVGQAGCDLAKETVGAETESLGKELEDSPDSQQGGGAAEGNLGGISQKRNSTSSQRDSQSQSMLESPFSYDREDRDSEGKLYRSGSQQTLSRQSVAENPTVARLARGDDASNGCPNITPFQSANGSGGDNPLAETRSGGAPPSRRRSRSNSHSELAKTAVGLREIARKIGRAQLIWDRPPKSVLIVTKLHDPQLVKITHHVAKWLITDVQLTVYVEERLKSDPSFRYEQIAEELRSHERAANTNKKAVSAISSYESLVTSLKWWKTCASTTSSTSTASQNEPNPSSVTSTPSEDQPPAEPALTPQPSKIDFVITLGGDGTVLFAAWLFQNKCPPLLPFRLGSLGFLTTFDFAVFRKTITETVMETGLTKGLRMNFRMRFSCTIRRYNGGSAQPKNAVSNGKSNDTSEDDPDHNTTYQILNDLTIDRGPSPFMSQLELYGNDTHLTTVHADGLIISTPTGSTAYSLSSGGSLVHPDVSAILVTPICPHTLSFRPMILPDTMELRIAVPSDSRATAYASFDGRKRVCLGKGDCVVVKAANWPVPSVCWEDQSRDWFRGLERCLGWNRRERQQGLDDGGDRDEGDDGQMDMEW